MRTTLTIKDPVFKRAKYAAEKDRKQLSMLVTEAVEVYLIMRDHQKKATEKELHLPSYSMGVAKVNINHRDALYRVMEE